LASSRGVTRSSGRKVKASLSKISRLSASVIEILVPVASRNSAIPTVTGAGRLSGLGSEVPFSAGASQLDAGRPVEIPSDDILLSPLLGAEELEATPDPELFLLADPEVDLSCEEPELGDLLIWSITSAASLVVSSSTSATSRFVLSR
jgi:hypothetical protein